MSGAIVQVIAYGAQDLYLTANPEITFFKVIYRRHTNFASECMETPITNASFGKKAFVVAQRTGDLITKAYLKVKLPTVRYNGKNKHAKFAWVRKVGNVLLEDIECNIGGAGIDKHYGDFYNMWQDLTRKPGQRRAEDRMIGDIPELTKLEGVRPGTQNLVKDEYTLYVPLLFWFCRNYGLALPLIALQYHEVKFIMKFRDLQECVVTSGARYSEFSLDSNDLDATMYINYIFLDDEERKKYAQSGHEYLVEQLQMQEQSITSASQPITLNFNHPCKFLLWGVYSGIYKGHNFLAYTHDQTQWKTTALHDAATNILHGRIASDNEGHVYYMCKDKDRVIESYLPSGLTTDQLVKDFDELNEYSGMPISIDGKEYVPVNNMSGSLIQHIDGIQMSLLEQLNGQNNEAQQNDYESYEKSFILFKYHEKNNSPYLQTDKSSSSNLLDKVTCSAYYLERDNVENKNANDNSSRYNLNVIVDRNDLTVAHISKPTDSYIYDNRTTYAKSRDIYVNMHHNTGLLIDGSMNPIVKAKLVLNGHDRIAERTGDYYNYVVPTECDLSTPEDGVNLLSFSLNPKEHQPSSTCNMSRIDSAILHTYYDVTGNSKNSQFNRLDYLGIGSNIAFSSTIVKVFTFNYNVGRVISGMFGTAYSN